MAIAFHWSLFSIVIVLIELDLERQAELRAGRIEIMFPPGGFRVASLCQHELLFALYIKAELFP